MAAVDVTMDVMERENTPQRSAVRGAQLRDALEEFKKRFAFIAMCAAWASCRDRAR